MKVILPLATIPLATKKEISAAFLSRLVFALGMTLLLTACASETGASTSGDYSSGKC